MERHIGTWEKESNKGETDVGELIIDGNHIEFYSRFGDSVFPEAFVGSDGNHSYKVFTHGLALPGKNRIIEYSSSYRVLYVLMQNCSFPNGNDISGIKEFSFAIPELVGWIGLPLVVLSSTPEKELAATEIALETITINESNPRIELYTESKSFDDLIRNDNTTVTLKKEPRIRVTYEKAVDVSKLLSDVECIMQFFGLLIGKVSYVNDIRLSIEGQNLKSWLYLNRDFSYNCMSWNFMSKPRTYLYVIEDKIKDLFYNWRNFFSDSQFSMLRRIYFSVNDLREKYMEDVFVEYIRILDGYHTRISGDEDAQKKIRKALKAAQKDIKRQLYTDENRLIFEQTIKKELPEWEFNSSNIEDIAGWIASGYLGRKTLSHRLKELDSDFHILQENAKHIIGRNNDEEITDNKQIVETYYKELGDTRNYFSHYKGNTDGVLNFNQINDSIKALKALIISVFCMHMNMDKDLIRKIVAFDSELSWQTQFLIKKGEKAFLHPMEYIKELQKEE